jgi:hypothetical protein
MTMKKYLGALSAFALLVSAGAATAQQEEQQQQPQQQQQPGAMPQMEGEGTVGTVDQTSLILTMEDGTEYVLAEGNLLEGLQPGMDVRVFFEEQDGRKMVTGIAPARQQEGQQQQEQKPQQ